MSLDLVSNYRQMKVGRDQSHAGLSWGFLICETNQNQTSSRCTHHRIVQSQINQFLRTSEQSRATTQVLVGSAEPNPPTVFLFLLLILLTNVLHVFLYKSLRPLFTSRPREKEKKSRSKMGEKLTQVDMSPCFTRLWAWNEGKGKNKKKNT